jgi:predicted lipoprotein with Yx(FWY)xxD motif
VDTIKVSSPLLPSDFSAVTRADGAKQLAYKGWPLYFFHNDTKPGDTNGEGVNGVWFVMKPDYRVMVAQQGSFGTFLTDTTGKTLYVFTRDVTGMSNCTGSCIATWPAFNAGSIVAPSILKGTDFSTIARTDGLNQSAYIGRPLYYFSGDVKPGDTKGNAVNSVWFVANVSGSVPQVAAPVTTATTTVPTTIPPTARGGYGY